MHLLIIVHSIHCTYSGNPLIPSSFQSFGGSLHYFTFFEMFFTLVIIIERKLETEHDLAVSKEEIEALQERATLLSIELLEYKKKNIKLMKDYEGITDSILVLQ